MPMRRIGIDELKPGMKFNKSLFDKNLNIVLPAGKVLDDINLRNMKTRHLDFVETAGEMIAENEKPQPLEIKTDEPVEKKKIVVDKETAKYIDFYKECLTAVSNMYNRYRNENTMDTDKIQALATRIVTTIMSEKKLEIFISLVNIAGKGDYLANHIMNTTILSVLLGQRLGYSMVKLFNLALATLVYDVGMIKVPAYILEKEDKLTSEEFNQVKTHPIHSYQAIAKELNLPTEVARVGLEHHEKFDGTGYPRRIKGYEMSEMSKIVAIVDTYEALTKDRVYREGKDSYDAMKMVLGEGSKKLDPEILKTFLNMMSVYPVGGYVQLNTNAVAKVISADPVSPFRPTVKIMRDEFGDELEDGEVIRLSREKDIYIVKAIQMKQVKKDKAE
jgi:HD-GYP domain-containing protein (c-di-GMP phosphodiesterase class II)